MAEPQAIDDTGDAWRRTHLANERTFLAWLRSGLTALGVSVAVGRILPEFGNHSRWPYAALGVLYAVLGLAMVGYGRVRQQDVDRTVREGRYALPDQRVLGALTLLTAAIGLATILVVLVDL